MQNLLIKKEEEENFTPLNELRNVMREKRLPKLVSKIKIKLSEKENHLPLWGRLACKNGFIHNSASS